jgi:protein-S-isoprenylcysteine O-methyltransferase Ste14
MKTFRLLAVSALFLFVIPRTLLYMGRSRDAYMFPSSMLQNINLIGLPIFFTGFLLSITSIWQLYAYGSGMPWGDVADDSQSSRLVTKGLFRYTRNPMLLGYGLFIMGVGLYYRSFTTAFILSTLSVALVSFWIKRKEEPALAKRFGQEYIEYNEKTPFIIPRISKKND